MSVAAALSAARWTSTQSCTPPAPLKYAPLRNVVRSISSIEAAARMTSIRFSVVKVAGAAGATATRVFFSSGTSSRGLLLRVSAVEIVRLVLVLRGAVALPCWGSGLPPSGPRAGKFCAPI